MASVLEQASRITSPTNDGYGIVWALICPEMNASAIFGATDFRSPQTIASLTSTQRPEETLFFAEAMFRERRYRCPGFQVSPQEFEMAMTSGRVLPTSYVRSQLLPKQWFLHKHSKKKNRVQ